MDSNKPHPLVRVLLAVILMTFFGGGLALFLNLFIPFLSEGAFAIIALIIMAELLALFVVGKCVQVISALRKSTRNASAAARAEFHDSD